MKKIRLTAFILALVMILGVMSSINCIAQDDYTEGEVIIKLSGEAIRHVTAVYAEYGENGDAPAEDFAALLGLDFDLTGAELLNRSGTGPLYTPNEKTNNTFTLFLSGISTVNAINKLSDNPMIEYAEKNYIYHLDGGGSEGTSQIYTDVKPGTWYYDDVSAMYEKGIMLGFNGRFRPSSSITRCEIAAVYLRVLGDAAPVTGTVPIHFTDVPKNSWYYDDVCRIYDSGLMYGTADTLFSPMSLLTREEFCTVVMRLAEKMGIDLGSLRTEDRKDLRFCDTDKISVWARDGVSFCNDLMIVNGFEDGSFRPRIPVTRAQAAVMISRLCTLLDAPAEGKESPRLLTAGDLLSAPCGKISDAMKEDGFDTRLMKYFSENTDGNYMISPLSLRYCLGLITAGAAGETKDELLSALGVESLAEWTGYCSVFNGFAKQFSAAGGKLSLANSVWLNENFDGEFTDSYSRYVSANYGAEHYLFNADNAAEKINLWADKKTNGMIKKIVPDDYVAENLAVALMNALYVKDKWVNPFLGIQTREGDFTTADGTKVKKDFMHQESRFKYYEDEKTKVVILPLEGGVSMAYVLGDTEGIGEKISACKEERVALKIPKIDLETSFDKKEIKKFLNENGVRSAFDMTAADFSEMIRYDNDGERLYLEDIIQKTRLKTDESGLEAAAVTMGEITMGTAADIPEPKKFSADRPFSFYIYTTCGDTTAIMFAGEIRE